MRQLFRGAWTDAKARRVTRKLVREIDDRLNELGYLWGDEDQMVVNIADALKAQFAEHLSDLEQGWKERDAERASEGGGL